MFVRREINLMPDIDSTRGWSEMHHYARNGDYKSLQISLKSGKYINTCDEDGRTALHMAAAHGQRATLLTLLDLGLRGNPEEDDYMVPVSKDQRQRSPHASYGACQGPNHSYMSHIGTNQSDRQLEVEGYQELLVSTQSNVPGTPGQSYSHINLFVREDTGSIRQRCVSDHHYETLLTAAGQADSESIQPHLANAATYETHIDAVGGVGSGHACPSGDKRYGTHIETVPYNPKCDSHRNSAEDLAVFDSCHAWEENMSSSIDLRFDIDVQDKHLNTALHYAAAKGHIHIMRTLLANRAAIHARNKRGWTALHFATKSGHLEAAELLLNNSSTLSSDKNDDGQTAFHLAAQYGHCEMLELLLDNASTPYLGTDIHGQSPLHLAALHGRSKILPILRDMCDVNKRDEAGYAPLHLATIARQYEMVHHLLQSCGAEPNVVDTSGETCLHKVTLRQDIQMIHILVDGGVDPAIAADSGKTSIDKAEEIPGEQKRIDVLVALFKRPPAPPDTITPISTDEWYRSSARHGRDLPRLIREQGLYPPHHAPYTFRPMKGVDRDFVERQLYEGAYPMDADPRGQAIILNITKFTTSRPRTGTTIDVLRLSRLFHTFGFRVSVWEDLTADEITERIRAVKQRMSKDCDAFVFVVMSHGGPGYIRSSDDATIDIDKQIIEPFDGRNCPKLQSKPKIFIFQACRGQVRDVPPSPCNDGEDDEYFDYAPPGEAPHPKADIVQIYSTYMGYQATRGMTGSWFIEEFVLMCELFAHEADLLELFRRANQALKHRKSYYDTSVQIAQQTSSLDKKLFFFPGYYRHEYMTIQTLREVG